MFETRFRKAWVFTSAVLTSVPIALSMQLPVHCADAAKSVQKQQKSPVLRISPTSYRLTPYTEPGYKKTSVAVEDSRPIRKGEVASNSLLIMPNKADKNDAMQTIREVSGTIVKTIGSGDRTVWVVDFPSQDSFLKAEKALVNDKHLNKIQRNYVFSTQTNDQFFPSQTYLPKLNVTNAWSASPGEQNNTIAIIDTGVSLKNLDLAGKCYEGYDCSKDREKQKDTAGHGTMVSTTAAAINDNFILTAGPARNSRIFPINAYVKKIGGFPTSTLIEAMDQCIVRGLKIVNMSLNNQYPEYSISNKTYNNVLHSQFEAFHDSGGLVFNAAGNDGNEDTLNPRYPYLIVVSATDTASGRKASFSKYGDPVWFTAPGVGIVCSSKAGKGKAVSVSGTSFSSPLVASIAALIWGAKPSLTNTQVEQLLISTSNRNHDPDHPNYGVPNNFFGYGMPDAGKAMKTLFP
ncbi:S8/S53 family peptidase [Candidatus Obscuribacterales bacterium]|nr:S8/S53 family peptidase [Candidatus Obscuribacterales bacterium]MBX3152332.1 S8/S53 family peptidase [Candidatus Obscuribacterales bacterium]